MKLYNCQIFLLLLWSATISCGNVESSFSINPFGLLDGLINKILESTRPYLTDIFIENGNFETGPQEFGNFKGNFKGVSVKGLEKFKVKVLKTSFLDINNLTIVVERFTARGFYQINGTLAFPLGKSDIDVFGEGEFGAKFDESSVSMKVIIRFENSQKIVKDLDIFIGLNRMEVYLENIMGRDDLEKVFNKLMNDVGLTIFNYYKESILDAVKPILIKTINEILNNGEKIMRNGSLSELLSCVSPY